MNKIPNWARPKMEEYKRLADSKWHMSNAVHYIATLSEYSGYLAIELGPKDREDIPGSWYWYSVGYVIPTEKHVFKYMVKYHNEVYVHVNRWEELINTLESDLKEYNQKMLRALQKKVEQEINWLPG